MGELVEKNIYVLAEEPDLQTIMAVLGKSFRVETGGEGNTFQLHNGDMSVKIGVYSEEYNDEMKKFVEEQVKTVWGHFHQIETQETDVKINLLHQIRVSKSFIGVYYSFEDSGENINQVKEQEILEVFFAVLNELSGILLTERATKALDAEGRQIFGEDGTSEVPDFYPYDEQIPDTYREYAGEEPYQRRVHSLAEAKYRRIFVTSWLPLLPKETETELRGIREIAGRTMALLAVALYSECLLGENMSVPEAREYIRDIMESYGAEEFLSPAEAAYLKNDAPQEQDQISFSWQYENLYVMEWALGLAQELPFPDTICDVPLTVRLLKPFRTLDAVIQAAQMRSTGELLSAADWIYCLDWACVESRIHELPAPGGMDSGVVMERHKSLNWLIRDQDADWDDVDIST